MKLSKKKAKELSIAIWTHLSDDPDNSKINLPKELKKKIADFPFFCPLCALFDFENGCDGCPLQEANECCMGKADGTNPLYTIWLYSKDMPSKRQKSAKLILEIIKDWRIR